MQVGQVSGSIKPPHLPIAPPGVTRRTILGLGLATFLETLFPNIAQAGVKPPYAKPLPSLAIPYEIVQVREDPIPIVLVWLDGGSSQYETWDPKLNASEDVKGYFGAIKSQKGTNICNLLPNMLDVIDDCLILRNIYTTGIPDHPEQTIHTFSGSPETDPRRGKFFPLYPSFSGRITNEVLNPEGKLGVTVFNASHAHGSAPHPVALPSGTLYLKYPPNKTEGYPSPFGPPVNRSDLEARIKLREKIIEGRDLLSPASDKYEKLFNRANETLEDGLPKAFDLSNVPREVREDFGINPLGNAAITASRLIRSGAKFIVIHYGFWDTHYSLERDTKNLVPPFDKALSGLIKEVKDEAIIVVASEFGRTPKLNRGDGFNPPGRDHWTKAYSVLLAGKRIEPGVIGQTDNSGTIIGPDGEFHGAHLFATILKLAGYEMKWKQSRQAFPVWPIV